MHLLNIRALKQDLVAGRVTNYEVAIYLFLTGHVGVPIWYLEAMPEQFSFRELFIMGSIVATGLLIAYFGYRACYYANGGLPGKSFAERFVSVGFVVGLRLSLVLILPYFLVIWLLEIRSEQALRAPFLAFELIYFWRVRFHLTEMRESAPRAA